MRNEENFRLKDWYKAMKRSKIVSTQRELGEIIKNSDGEPMSQAFISSMMKGTSTVSEHTISSICEHYFFTTPSYFRTGEESMVSLHKLMQWILKKHKRTQAWLVKQLKDPEITEPILSLMDNNSEREKWQKVFNRLNKFGYDVNPVYLITQHAGELQEFTGKSDQVRKLFDAIEWLQYQRVITTKREFCEAVSEHAKGGRGAILEQTLSNMSSPRYKQDVTKDMAVAFLKAFPMFSADWFLLNQGPMLRDGASTYNMIQKVEQELKNLKELISGEGSKV